MLFWNSLDFTESAVSVSYHLQSLRRPSRPTWSGLVPGRLPTVSRGALGRAPLGSPVPPTCAQSLPVLAFVLASAGRGLPLQGEGGASPELAPAPSGSSGLGLLHSAMARFRPGPSPWPAAWDLPPGREAGNPTARLVCRPSRGGRGPVLPAPQCLETGSSRRLPGF